MAISTLEEVVLGEAYRNATPEKQQIGLDAIKEDMIAEHKISKEELPDFENAFNSKVKEYSDYVSNMGTERKTDAELRNINPEFYDKGMADKASAEKYIGDIKQKQEFAAKDPGLETPAISPEMAGVGVVRAGQGLIAGSKAMVQGGMGFAAGSVAGDIGAEAGMAVVDKGLSKDFKAEHPDLTMGLKLIASLGGGITLGIMAENRVLKSYADAAKGVQDGTMSAAQADSTIKQAKQDNPQDAFDAEAYLQKTIQPKVSDEFTQTKEAVAEAIAPTPPTPKTMAELVNEKIVKKSKERGLPPLMQSKKEASIVPIGGSEDEAAKKVNDLSKKPLDKTVKNYSKADIAELERMDAEDALLEAETLFTKGGDNLAAGFVAGVETDENGIPTGIDTKKFILGLGGYTALKTLAKNKTVQKELREWAGRKFHEIDTNPKMKYYLGKQNVVEDVKVPTESKGLLERKAETRLSKGLPEKGGKEVYHPTNKKNYFYHPETDKVFFKRGNGQWKETPNEEIRAEIKFIDKNGVKSFENKSKEELMGFKEPEKTPQKDTYKDQHTAPQRGQDNGTSIDNLTRVYPKDIYGADAARYYGHGGEDIAKDREAIRILQKIKGNPDAKVKIYRAIPENVNAEINPQDWVTITKKYAVEHGESRFNGKYKLLEKEVKASDIFTDGNSIHEQGYDPKTTSGQPIYSGYTIGSSIAGGLGGASVDINQDGNIDWQDVLIGAAGGAAARGSAKLLKMWESGKIKNLTHFPDETKLQIFQRKMQDKFNRVNQLQKFKTKGGELPDKANPYQAEELYSGKTQTRLEEFTESTINPLEKKIATTKLTVDDIDEYLHARHAAERNARMKEVSGIENGSGMSNADANKILEKWAGNKEIEDIASDIYKINKDRLRLIVSEGLEPKDFIKLEEMYDNYVPLKREMDTNGFSGGTGKGFDIKGKETKRAKGSHRKVESPTAHSIMAMQETIIRAEKNKVGQAFLEFTNQFPDDKLYTVSSLKYTPRFDKNGAVQMMEPQYSLKDNFMHVKVDGKIKQIEIHDKALADAFKNLNATEMNGILQVAHKGVRLLAGLNTQWNPEFVVSNFERDLQTAMINLPNAAKPNRAKFLADVPLAIKGIYRAERGKKLTSEWQKLFNEMKAEGGTTGWMDQYDLPKMAEELNYNIEKLQGKHLTKEAFKSTLKYIDNVNTSVENGVRLVAYKQAKNAGLSNAKAASIAKNLTVNFNRKGEWGTFMNTAYMFYNASIQGSIRMVQALKTSNTAKMLAGGIMGSAVGLNYYNQSVNKEAYDLLPDFEKDTNYIFMRDDGTYSKIKVPYGYNIFKVIGDLTAEVANGKIEKKEIPGRMLGAMVNAFSPIGSAPTFTQAITPTLVKPIVEIETNKNFFGGNISPEPTPFQPDNISDAHKYYKNVNPAAKYAAQALNEATGGSKHLKGYIDISPETIEHITEFVAGGLGKTVMRTLETATNAYQGKEQDVNKTPMVRAFSGKVREKAGLHEAYSILKQSGNTKLSENKQTKFKALLKEAFNNKEIDAKTYFKMSSTLRKSQGRVGWSQRHNVQDYADLSRSDIIDGLTSGLSKSEMIKILKERKNGNKKNKL